MIKLSVIGDSMVKYLNQYLTYESLHCDINVSSFPGAKIESLRKELPALGPCDWILLHVGTNNLQDDDVSEIVRKYYQLFDEVSRLHPGAKVVVSGIVPRNPNRFLDYQLRCTYKYRHHLQWLNHKTEVVNSALEKACLSREAFYFCRSSGSWDGLLAKDGLHPSWRGNCFLAEMFTKVLKGLLAMDAALVKKVTPSRRFCVQVFA